MIKATKKHLKAILRPYPSLLNGARIGASALYGGGLKREARALAALVASYISPSRWSARYWLAELPVQAPSLISASQLRDFLDVDEIVGWCKKNNFSFGQGGDAIYLPPPTWAASPLGFLRKRYPAGAGLKIARNPGDANGYYMGAKLGRTMAQRRSYSHRHQTIVYNFFHSKKIGPRLYDLLELDDNKGGMRAAYVVEHVDGVPPSPTHFSEMVAKLKKLAENDDIELVSGSGWEGSDFQPPDGRGNMIVSKNTGEAYYVDVHNFILPRYRRHLEATAKSSAGSSHFGEKSAILGGKFLYQAVPGVRMPAKRSPVDRMVILDAILAESGVGLKDKVVFDIGCNLGLMGAEYLRRGARWVHGWDMPDVVSASRDIQLAVGCTRFSHTPGPLSADVDLAAHLPEHLRSISSVDGVVNYLAIRGHVGWLPALADLPWRYMIYEGHQNDAPLNTYVEELNRIVPIRVLRVNQVSDSLSSVRDVAIFERVS